MFNNKIKTVVLSLTGIAILSVASTALAITQTNENVHIGIRDKTGYPVKLTVIPITGMKRYGYLVYQGPYPYKVNKRLDIGDIVSLPNEQSVMISGDYRNNHGYVNQAFSLEMHSGAICNIGLHAVTPAKGIIHFKGVDPYGNCGQVLLTKTDGDNKLNINIIKPA